VREHLGVDKWLLRGGSWGVTLSLAYAERYPERVSGMLMLSVTSTRRLEIDWLYRGVGRFFPEAWARFRDFAGLTGSYRLPTDGTPPIRHAESSDRVLRGQGARPLLVEPGVDQRRVHVARADHVQPDPGNATPADSFAAWLAGRPGTQVIFRNPGHDVAPPNLVCIVPTINRFGAGLGSGG
jgi:pimeloyl-ACP methyl ester carboxylesterase